MKSKVSAQLCVAGMLALGVGALAQEPAKQDPPAARTATEQQITVTGCIVREADYRSTKDAGKGGVAGTGVGAGNEFVLTDAKVSSGASGETASPTGTSGSTTAYELSGTGEGKASEFVGRRVEITGTLKAADVSASGRPTGGATAGQPPSGVDVTSKDLKLREINVVSVKEATGTCAPAK